MRSCVFVLFMILTVGVAGSTSYGVEELNVTVEGSSLADPIGVCYGKWEGAEPLIINLSATGSLEIASAETYLPEDVIWNPTDASSPDPWTFETTGTLPDEAFAVMFKGKLKPSGAGGRGGGEKADWAAAVSDIDLDCDSDNDSSLPYRAPSRSSIEDDLEFASGSSSTDPPGMVLSIGEDDAVEDWRKLIVSAHLKRSGYVSLQISGDTLSFIIADSEFSVLGQITIPSVNPETGNIVIYEESPTQPSYSKTFYIKPVGGAVQEDDQLTVTAVFAAGPIAQGSQTTVPAEKKAIDKVTARGKKWALSWAAPGIVMVEADGNYDAVGEGDPWKPAKMKKLVVKPAADATGDTTFVFKRTYPQGKSSKLRIYKENKTDEVTFNVQDTSQTLTVSDGTTFWVKGKSSGTPENAHTEASSEYNKDCIELCTGTQANPSPKLHTSEWTALWIKLTIEATGAIPDDNKAKGTYKVATEQDTLGHIGQGVAGNRVGIKYGVQLKGTVYPADLPKGTIFSMKRVSLGGRLYLAHDGQPVQIYAGFGSEEDTSLPFYLDEVHQTNLSTDKIFDLDTPGWKGSAEDENTLANAPDKTHVAARSNFKEWVQLKDERCSELYPWYYRRASKKNGGGAQGQWNTTNVVAGDNTAARGTTEIGWALQQLPMKVSLTVDEAYKKDNLTAAFTATVVRGTANFTYHWVFENAKNPNPDDVTKAARTDQQNMAFKADKQNHGEHRAGVQVTDSAAPQHADREILTVLTNKRPIPRVYTKVDVPNNKVRVYPSVVEPDNKITSYRFKVDYYYTVGPSTGTWFTKANGVPMAKQWQVGPLPANLDYVIVTMEVKDEYDAVGEDKGYAKK